MKIATSKGVETVMAVTSEYQSSLLAPDIINVVRGLRLNNLRVPKWLALEYNAIETRHVSMPVVPQVSTHTASSLVPSLSCDMLSMTPFRLPSKSQ
jgi:hypothetical protein